MYFEKLKALVGSWGALWDQLEAEIPMWRLPKQPGVAPKTYALVKTVLIGADAAEGAEGRSNGAGQ
jgi:hypothetical protein